MMIQTSMQNGKSPARSRSTTREFLLRQSDSKPEDTSRAVQPSVGLDDLAKKFPDMRSGDSFLDSAMDRLRSARKFCALVIRIDPAEPLENRSATDRPASVRIHVAETVDAVCKKENGMWGHLNQDLFGSFFPGIPVDRGFDISKTIQAKLAAHERETVTIGVAPYPTLNYTRRQTLENAHKALNHAHFFGPGSAVAFDAVSLNISADQLYQEGDIDGAVAEFIAGLKLDPSNVNIRNSLGVCYGVLGKYEKAIAEFEAALWLDGGEVMAIYNLGLVHLLMENKEKALGKFLEAANAGEDIYEVAFQTGKLYLESDRPEQGKPFLEKAVQIRPESAIAFRYLGQCYAALNQTEEAVDAYKKAVKLNPNDAFSLSALGYLFELQGENSEIATLFCQKSTEISPENGLFRHRLGRLYLKQNRFQDALKEFIQATKLGHDSVEFVETVQNRINEGQ